MWHEIRYQLLRAILVLLHVDIPEHELSFVCDKFPTYRRFGSTSSHTHTHTHTNTRCMHIQEDWKVNMIYLNMLEMFVLPIVSQWDSYEALNCMQDGAPPHFALPVYTGRWIGRGGPTQELPRSPDLTPREFSCCGLDQRRCLIITTTNT
jgi:hypothetical protein